MRTLARQLIVKHEGCRLKPYEDPAGDGSIAIGFGRNLTHRGINREEADYMLDSDLDEAERWLSLQQGWHQAGPVRQAALCDAYHALGPNRLSGFKRMWAAVKVRDWPLAATELLDSKWGREYPDRVSELADMLRRGGEE